jgi:hypothetical protein
MPEQAIGCQVEEITPAAAEKMLERNTRNRSLRPDYVRQLAGAMERQEWVVNGQPIQLAEDGTLLNGQHRLSAVVQSGVTVPIFVVRGLPTSSLKTMDVGTRRNLSDVLGLHGHMDATNLAAALGLLHRYRSGARLEYSGRTAPTVTQALSLLEEEPDIKDAVTEARRIYRVTGMRLSVAALLLYLFEEEDPGVGRAFFERFCDPAAEEEGSAIRALRSHVDRIREESNYQFSTVTLIAVTIKAFNAWRLGKRVEVLSFRPGGDNPEPFPVIHKAEIKTG